MSVPQMRNSWVSGALLICCVFFTYFPGLILSGAVTLRSIEIFKTHQWLKVTPNVYFLCKGENKTVLPDVKKPNVFYTFKGAESWQPLTNFSSEKCKRCGFYEEDSIISDEEFDEWEFCPSDFTTSDGKYIRFKEKEFNATFLCPECLPSAGVAISESDEHYGRKIMRIAIVVLLCALVLAILILGVVGAYKFWQKKKRQQEQARFLKLFEEGDDIEDELGLGTVI